MIIVYVKLYGRKIGVLYVLGPEARTNKPDLKI